MPKFSIIVPVYNVEKYLDECVQSVISQTFADWELLLVDDGSPDGCPAICDKYAVLDSRIKALHKKNGGASDARNHGLDSSTGEYVIFLDGDDYWNDSKALEVLNEKISESGCDTVIFGCTDFNMISGAVVVSRSGYDLGLFSKGSKSDILHYLMSSKLLPGGPTIFTFKKELADKNSLRFKVGVQDEDYDFVLGIFFNSESISALNNPFYMYRQGRTDSVTGSADIKMIYGIEYTLNKWLPFAENLSDEILKKDLLNYLAFIYSTGFVLCGRMNREMRKSAVKIMKKYKFVLKYSYWKKATFTRYAVMLIGTNLFSVLASRLYEISYANR